MAGRWDLVMYLNFLLVAPALLAITERLSLSPALLASLQLIIPILLSSGLLPPDSFAPQI